MGIDHLIRLDDLGSERTFDRIRRPLVVAGFSLTIWGLILGVAYGGAIVPFALLIAVLFGGLFYREAIAALGAEPYANILLGILVGAVFGSIAISSLVSSMLSTVSAMDAIWATSINILAATVTVTMFWLLGFVVALGFMFLRVRVTDRTGIALIAIGIPVYAATQVRPTAIHRAIERLAAPLLSLVSFDLSLLYLVGASLASLVIFTGFFTILTSDQRRRIGLVAVVVLSVIAGGVGLARVGTQIGQAHTAANLATQVTAEPVGADLREDSIDLRVRVSNPSSRPVELSGFFVTVTTRGGDRLSFGPGERVDGGPAILGAGETMTVTYRVRFSPSRMERFRETVTDDGVVIDGRVGLRLVDAGFLPSDRDARLAAHFRCVLVQDHFEC